MILNISDRNLTVIQKGVYYFELSDYPRIRDYELNNIMAYINYEKAHGRQTELICEDSSVLAAINSIVADLDGTKYIPPIASDDDFVYHATDSVSAQKILSSGKLLSAINVYGKTGEELSFERFESNWSDPPDYFEYIMFCWGDNPTGDYVVLSEDFPSEDDLSEGNFDAGVRFYFRFGDIIRHPKHVFDGYHAIKIKDEIKLSDYLYACIVPEQYMDDIKSSISLELAAKVHHLPQKGLGILDWNDKAFDYVCRIKAVS